MLAHPGKQTLLVGSLALLLAACGGGGGGGSSSPSSAPAPAPSPAPSPAPAPSPVPAPTPAAMHSVQLSWSAPATRADGSPLAANQLAGYRIYYTATDTPANADTMLPVSGGATTSLKVNLPSAGEYSFAITALDQSGLESSLSAPVSVSVP